MRILKTIVFIISTLLSVVKLACPNGGGTSSISEPGSYSSSAWMFDKVIDASATSGTTATVSWPWQYTTSSGCSISSTTLMNSACSSNFGGDALLTQSASISAGDMTRVQFTISQGSVWDKTLCMRACDQSGTCKNTVFKVRTRCTGGSYTAAAPSDFSTTNQRYFEQYINAAATVTWSDFTTGNLPSACTFSSFEIYSDSAMTSQGVSGVSFTTNANTKSITVASSVATSLTKKEFYIAANWQGYKVRTDKVTVQVVCGSDTVSASQSSKSLDSFDAPSSLTTVFDKSNYQFLSTTKSACPITHWEVWADDGTNQWSAASLSLYTGTRVKVLGSPANGNLQIENEASSGSNTNWFMKYIIRGYTESRNNQKIPVTTSGDIAVTFRVCGWETISDPASGGNAVNTLTLKVEAGTTRSTTVSWGEFTESSATYPSWSGVSTSTKLCPIVSYRASSSGTSYVAYSAQVNTASTYNKLLRTYDGSLNTRQYTVDTADDTSKLGTETFWIEVLTTGGVTKYQQNQITLECGDETITTPSSPVSFTIEQITATNKKHSVIGFTTNMPKLCGITAYTIEKVEKASDNSAVTNWASYMQISADGIFEWTDISQAWPDLKVFISATSRGGVKSSTTLHVLTVRVTWLCGQNGAETLSLSQWSPSGTSVDRYISEDNTDPVTYLSNNNAALLTKTITRATYSGWYVSSIADDCPVYEWEIWQDNSGAWSGSESKVTGSAGLISIDSNFDVTYKVHNAATPKNNWYNKFKLRGFTKARYNPNPYTVNKNIDMWLEIQVCGWQELKSAPDSGDPIPATRTLKVEVGAARTKEYTIGPYGTTSTKYPSWHATKANQEICPISQWRLSSTTGSYTAYAAASNTAATYQKLLRTWDVATQKFLIDTADDTSKLGTETFYIEITSYGNKIFYMPVQTTLECGDEVLTTPSAAVDLTCRQQDSSPKNEHSFTTFSVNMPRLCGLTWHIGTVKDKNDNVVSNSFWGSKFSLVKQADHSAKFSTTTATIIDHYKIFIWVETPSGKKSSQTFHTMTLTVEPTCYREVVSLATFTENGATVSRYINQFSTRVAAYYPAQNDGQWLTDTTITKSTYASWFLSTISVECPVAHWEIWQDSTSSPQWSAATLTKVTGTGGLISIDSNYDITFKTHNMGATKNNWYNKYILRGYSKARDSLDMAKDITVDMTVLIDVCGNEQVNPNPDSGNNLNLVVQRTFKVEIGNARSHTFTFGPYSTNSAVYPTWHATKAGQEQCPITGYSISSSGTSDVPITVVQNTAASYQSLIWSWSDSTRTFVIDTADDTTKIGTETFWVVITTRGTRKFFYQVKTTVECGNEIITYPGGAFTFEIEQLTSVAPNNAHTLTGFSTTINRVCGVNQFTIDKVVKTASNTNWDNTFIASHFTIDGAGKFTITDISQTIETSKVYVTATTVGGIKTPSIHALNIQVKDLCRFETLSLTQEAGSDKQLNIYKSIASDQSVLTAKYENFYYKDYFISSIAANCPVEQWEIWEDNGANAWSAASLVKITGTTGIVYLDSNYDFVYRTYLGTSPKNNWYNKYVLRGYTKARNNPTQYQVVKSIDMWVNIDVCGWEDLSAAPTSGNAIPATRTLKVEKGSARTQSFTFGPYETSSTKYPTWHANAGQEQCPITGYTLSSTTGSNTVLTPADNTAANYIQLLKTWDASTRTFNIDTAEETTKLGTETFYVRVVTRGGREFYKQVQTTVECGNEVVAAPSAPIVLTVQKGDAAPKTQHQFTTFTSDFTRVCNINKYTIEKVEDKNGNLLAANTWNTLLSISNTGLFETKTTDVLDNYKVWISAETPNTKTSIVHAITLTVEPPCYRETLSLTQVNGADKALSWYTNKISTWYPAQSDNTLLTQKFTAQTEFKTDFLTTIAACPATDWEIWEDTNASPQWSSATLTKVTANPLISIDGKGAGGTFDVTILTHNNQATKNNWYNKFVIRGYSKARENPIMPKDITKDMVLLVDVCGNEQVNSAPDSGNDLTTVATRTLKIEKGTTRSHSFTFGPYSTNSVNYPSWHANSGQKQCNVANYHLSSSSSSFVAYTAEENTGSTYKKLLRTFDASTRTFLIDTADDTSKLGTETFYIEIRTRGMRSVFKQVQTTVTCGDEVISSPSTPMTFVTREKDVNPNNQFSLTSQYTTDMPRVCGYTTWKVEQAKTKTGTAVSAADITRLFSISTAGLFQTATTDVLDSYDLWISGVTPSGKTTGTNVHGLKLTVEPYCYREVLSIPQVTNTQGQQVGEEFTKLFTKGLLYNTTQDAQYLTDFIPLSDYQSKFSSTISDCPAHIWEIYETSGTKITGTSGLISIDSSTYKITIKTDNGATPKNNWIGRYILKAYSKAKVNPIMPKDNIVDMFLNIEVCGWEVPSNPVDQQAPLIPSDRKLYIEKPSTRTKAYTFGQYSTTSTKYPSWHANSGKELCPITGYYLSSSGTQFTEYKAEKNYVGNYQRQLRSWDATKREFLIDTADDTTKLGTETFYVQIRTRGGGQRFYEVKTTLICGEENISVPEKPHNFAVEQNATAEDSKFQLSSYTSDMPNNCGITSFNIVKVLDENGSVIAWKDLFQLSNTGEFQVLDTTKVFKNYVVYISAKTPGKETELNIPALKVSVIPLIQAIQNSPPVFEGVTGYELKPLTLWTGSNYLDSPYFLPKITDPDGNKVWVFLELLSTEQLFMRFVNTSNAFYFKDLELKEAWKGTYKIKITVGDDNWKGPLVSNYTLTIDVKVPPKPIIVEAPKDTSYKGAEVKSMGVTGGVTIKFKEKMYINPLWIKQKKRLLAEQTNTTWVIQKEAPKRGELPDNPVYDPKLIDESVFDIKVNPSEFQDKSKVGLTWVTDSLDENQITFQVLYHNFEYISQEGQDELVMKVKDNEALLSKNDGGQLFNEGYEFKQPIRKQLPPPTKFANFTPEIASKKQYIDSETFQNSVKSMESITKKTIAAVLLWSFLTGSKNLDFLWSYLGTLQILSHLALLKITIPMNVMVMSKSLMSISVLDYELMNNNYMNLTQLYDTTKAAKDVTSNIQNEITKIQFFELDYKEAHGFFANLRCSIFWLVSLMVIWVLTFICWLTIKRGCFRVKKYPWLPRATLRRLWYYLGPNGLLRLLILEFFLVLFSGYIVFRRQIQEFLDTKGESTIFGFQFNFFVVWLSLPILVSLVVTFCPKEFLIKRYMSINLDTLYFKSNLLFISSRSYSLVLLLQKLLFAAVIVYIDNITIQACVMILSNLMVCWIIMSIDFIYLDKHLKFFERVNQALLSLVQIVLVLMTDFVYTRQMQYNFGYFYALLMCIYNFIGLTVATLYAFEPVFTWIRLSYLRMGQIELAVNLRATLIKEAKERKEERKQKKIAAFNNFVIDIGGGLNDTIQEDEEGEETEEQPSKESAGIKKKKTKKEKPWTQIGIVKEERVEETLTSEADPIQALQQALEKPPLDQTYDFGNPEPKENEDSRYEEILDQLTLLDRVRYQELIGQYEQSQKMRAQMVLADLDDEGDDLDKSGLRAQEINERFNYLLSPDQITQEKNKITLERDFSPDLQKENIEYHSYINALDSLIHESQREMQEIEQNYGIREIAETQPEVELAGTFDLKALFGN